MKAIRPGHGPRWLSPGRGAPQRPPACEHIILHAATAWNLRLTFWFLLRPGTPKAHPKPENQKEWQMNAKHLILASCAVMALSIGAAQAGPCDMTGKAASAHDAGSGPTPGNTGQATTGTGTGSSTNEHPPTSTMNRASGDVAASSQDAQKQMQGQPTAAQQAQGAKSTGQGC
jgi:hypothetical protein